nr:class I SAM-dependent methyltransferase [uncultured Undibacterium sp.]
MKIADLTVKSHKEICCQEGIFDNYDPNPKKDSSVGGSGVELAQDHLLNRFINSAARTQAFAICDDQIDTSLYVDFLSHFDSGEVHVIDVAAGHGAGLISIVNTIHHLRDIQVLAKSALNIFVHAIDYSEESLEFYRRIIQNLSSDYPKSAISISLKVYVTDLTDIEALNNTIDEIIPNNEAAKTKNYFMLCSAITGVTKENFMSEFSDSFKFLAARLSNKTCIFLWIEPKTKKNWISKYWTSVWQRTTTFRRKILGIKNKELGSAIKVKWKDPYSKEDDDSLWVDADVLMIKFGNSQ